MIYYVGLVKGTGTVACWGNNHRRSTVVVEMRRDLDFLSPDLWEYIGPREVTKSHVKTHRLDLLKAINVQYNADFQNIIID